MEFIHDRHSNILFSLYGSKVNRIRIHNKTLTLTVDEMYQLVDGEERAFSGEISFKDCDVDLCKVLIFNKTLREGRFTAKSICLHDFMNEYADSEFEIITVLMLLYFKKENIDFGVIEVGLGGTLDSTNVIKPIIQVITSISFDHTNLLGNTLEKIAREKVGIIKKGIPTVIYPQQEEVLKVIKNKCFEMDSELYIANNENLKFKNIVNLDKPYQLLKYNNEIDILLPLLGEHQIINLSVAMQAIEVLNNKNIIDISIANIVKSIKNVSWKGRLEVLSNNPYGVIDGAHNIQGIKTLSRNIKKYFKYENLYLILGILADKDVEEMIKIITPMAKKVYSVTPNSIRGELAESLKDEVSKFNKNCKAFDKYEEAYLEALNDASEKDLILASGSLYMIGDMRKIIRKISQ